MPRSSYSTRLEGLAAPLAPARAPYHVDRFRSRGHPAFGWYLVLGDGRAPHYLGPNHVQAEVRLLELLELHRAA